MGKMIAFYIDLPVLYERSPSLGDELSSASIMGSKDAFWWKEMLYRSAIDLNITFRSTSWKFLNSSHLTYDVYRALVGL
jgi:hypothetical protein